MKVSPLRMLRLAAGYSQDEMGRLLDIHPSLVSRYEHNRREIPKDLREKFVALCSSRIDWPAFILLAEAHRRISRLFYTHTSLPFSPAGA